MARLYDVRELLDDLEEAMRGGGLDRPTIKLARLTIIAQQKQIRKLDKRARLANTRGDTYSYLYSRALEDRRRALSRLAQVSNHYESVMKFQWWFWLRYRVKRWLAYRLAPWAIRKTH